MEGTTEITGEFSRTTQQISRQSTLCARVCFVSCFTNLFAMTKATSCVYSSSVCVSGFQRLGCLVIKGRTTSVYSLWMFTKSVFTASEMPVPFNSVSLSSLDLNG